MLTNILCSFLWMVMHITIPVSSMLENVLPFVVDEALLQMSNQSFYSKIEDIALNQSYLLLRGDHIAAEAEIYYHHGIYLGSDMGIAEFGGDKKKDFKPRIVDFQTFTHNGTRRLVRMVSNNDLPLETAAQNAEYLVHNPKQWGPYNLLNNNCEHFATMCKTNKSFSLQVKRKIEEYRIDPKLLLNDTIGLFCS